jgi:hypothetical protein
VQFPQRDIAHALLKKGFIKKETHHTYFHHVYKGFETGVSTYLSHGKGMDYSGKLIGDLKRQLQFDSPQQLADFIRCPMDEDTYNKILVAKKIFDPKDVEARLKAAKKK